MNPSEVPGSWRIFDRYFVKDGRIGASGRVRERYYRPQHRTELPFEIAKLAEADERAISRFVERWGLLGYAELRSWEKHLPPNYYQIEAWSREPGPESWEPLDFIRQHGRNLAFCVSTLEALVEQNAERAVEAMTTWTEGNRRAAAQWGGLVRGPGYLWVDDSALVDPLRSTEGELESMVSGHIRGIYPYVQARAYDPELDTGAYPALQFQFTGMVETAYLHVAHAWIEQSRIDRCEECGAVFRKRHGLQRFCSPPPANDPSTGQPITVESRCAYRNRYKRTKGDNK